MNAKKPSIPADRRLDLFRYHCFLQAFRTVIKLDDPIDYGEVAQNAINFISMATSPIQTGINRGGQPGKTTYFEFAYLLSLPAVPAEGPSTSDGVAPMAYPKFHLTTDADVRTALTLSAMGVEFTSALRQHLIPQDFQGGLWVDSAFPA